jgi:hypothetical protein
MSHARHVLDRPHTNQVRAGRGAARVVLADAESPDDDPGELTQPSLARPSSRAEKIAAAQVGTTLAERLRYGTGPATALAERQAGHLLPVSSSLAPLFPAGGLRRGSTIAVRGSTSLLLALLAEASAAGSWCAVIGLPALGAVAAVEAGIAAERLALVPDPGAEPGAVAAALLDGVDIVVVGSPGGLQLVDVRRLVARARQRGSVLIGVGNWPGAELRLEITDTAWYGLGDGHGHLKARAATIVGTGRGSASRPRRVRVWLPAAGGGVAAPVDPAIPAHSHRTLDRSTSWPAAAEAS